MTDPITLPESKIALDGGPNVYGACLDPIERKSLLALRGDGTWGVYLNGNRGDADFSGTRDEAIEFMDERAVERQMARRPIV